MEGGRRKEKGRVRKLILLKLLLSGGDDLVMMDSARKTRNYVLRQST